MVIYSITSLAVAISVSGMVAATIGMVWVAANAALVFGMVVASVTS